MLDVQYIISRKIKGIMVHIFEVTWKDGYLWIDGIDKDIDFEGRITVYFGHRIIGITDKKGRGGVVRFKVNDDIKVIDVSKGN